MYLQICSDLHLEFMNDPDHVRAIAHKLAAGEKPKDTWLVIAGDFYPFGLLIGGKNWGIEFLGECKKIGAWTKVLYVPGNHEYYYNKKLPPNHLDCLFDTFFIMGLRKNLGSIYATTLWFPGKNPLDHLNYSHYMNKYELPFEVVQQEHKKDIRFLEGVSRGSIVVTHHIPLRTLVNPKYKYEVTNAFFIGDADKIVQKQPKTWAFGHTHCSIDKIIGDTRFVCNPLGYYRRNTYENGFDFDWNKLIEI